MAITNDANTLVLNAVITSTLDEIEYISLRNISGEYFRKIVTDVTEVNVTKRTYSFFLDTSDGNDDIVEVALHGNGATVALDSGTTYATQPFVLTKDNTQSLTIDWTVEVV